MLAGIGKITPAWPGSRTFQHAQAEAPDTAHDILRRSRGRFPAPTGCSTT